MGNSLPLPPCVCHWCHHGEVVNDELEGRTAAVAGGVGSKKRRRRKRLRQRPADCSRNLIRTARPRHAVVPVVDDAAEDGGGGGREREAWPECRVERAGHGEDGGVRVRIVMKRKDIAQLVARLEQRGAEERDATAAAAGIEEVFGTELAGCHNGNDGGGGGGTTMMSPCRDAWRPRLSAIPENY